MRSVNSSEWAREAGGVLTLFPQCAPFGKKEEEAKFSTAVLNIAFLISPCREHQVEVWPPAVVGGAPPLSFGVREREEKARQRGNTIETIAAGSK